MGGILIPRIRPKKTVEYLPGEDVYSYSVYENFSAHRSSLRGEKNLSSHRLSLTSDQHRQLPYVRRCIVAPSPNICCHGYAVLPSLSLSLFFLRGRSSRQYKSIRCYQ